mmetsp:Transcript_22995/g.42187  ORF Transcript_22995/g.42187 Transcript_22995/m.42187 type:complete len:92 (+) Transcript_22995:207-482(+)
MLAILVVQLCMKIIPTKHNLDTGDLPRVILWFDFMVDKYGCHGSIRGGSMGLVGRLFAIAVICAGVELIPVGDDNWTVPLSAALLTAFLLN